jgi:hypothetical protein
MFLAEDADLNRLIGSAQANRKIFARNLEDGLMRLLSARIADQNIQSAAVIRRWLHLARQSRPWLQLVRRYLLAA